MDPMSILVPILVVVLIAFVVVLALLVLRLMKTLEIANSTLSNMKDQLEPTLENMKTITDDIQPTVRKMEPIVDRVQLTLDSVNLEMMRVDEILEDVAQITDSAASASNAVDNITSAPIKAVAGVANRVRERFGSKGASDESAQLADKRAAVEQALEEYKAAGEQEKEKEEEGEPAPEAAPAGPDVTQPIFISQPSPEEKPYMVIDPEAIENSPFFESKPDGE